MPAFSPQSRVQLKSAVDACLKLSAKGKCVKNPYGAIGTWDVSHVTDMSRMFARTKFFDSDLSKWDVSRVKNMRGMFLGATSFNADLSKWDVSSVDDMHSMFLGATLFKQNLCGAAWVHSKASKDFMFEGTSGSISSTTCAIPAMKPLFLPQSRAELKSTVDAYLQYSPQGDGLPGPCLTYLEWHVSHVVDRNECSFVRPASGGIHPCYSNRKDLCSYVASHSYIISLVERPSRLQTQGAWLKCQLPDPQLQQGYGPILQR